MALDEYGTEVVDFYEMLNNYHLHTPQCKIKQLISVKIVADPAAPNPEFHQEFKIHKPDKIDYFDIYNY